jgi:hypothetical protein
LVDAPSCEDGHQPQSTRRTSRFAPRSRDEVADLSENSAVVSDFSTLRRCGDCSEPEARNRALAGLFFMRIGRAQWRTKMFLKNPFAKKATEVTNVKSTAPLAPSMKLDIEALDSCVGGRAETEGVGCYLRSTPTSAH